MTNGLLQLSDWLATLSCTRVAIENWGCWRLSAPVQESSNADANVSRQEKSVGHRIIQSRCAELPHEGQMEGQVNEQSLRTLLGMLGDTEFFERAKP